MTRINTSSLTFLPRTQLTDSDQKPPAPPARACTPQGALVSLAEPPLGAESQPLAEVLLERVARCATPTPAHVSAEELMVVDETLELMFPYQTFASDPSNGPGPVLRDWTAQDEAATYLLAAAVDAILALDERDDTVTTDSKVLQEAANLLLALGQRGLLLRLAQLQVLSHFVFEVGLNPQSASVLERIGASWPPEASVAITLDSSLSTDCVRALQAFMQCPSSLSVHVRATGTIDVSAACTFAEVVVPRPLVQLTLDIHELSTDLLQALVGVQADAVCIRATRLFGTSGSASSQAPAYQDAAIELVRKSGARVLELPNSHVEGDFCARLLAINDRWEAVELNLSRPSAVQEWLIAARQTIGQLALAAWTGSGAADMADLLEWAEKNGVHTLVFHDTVYMHHMADALAVRLQKSTHVFERIEACFVVEPVEPDVASDSEDSSESIDLNVAYPWLMAFVANPLTTSLRHTPPEALQNDRPSRRAGEPLPDSIRDLLPVQSELNRGVSLHSRLADLWRTTIRTLGGYLHPGTDLSALFSYLEKPGSPLINPLALQDAPPHHGTVLEAKLVAFQLCGLDIRLIKGAVAHCVSENPGLGLPMYHALLNVGLLSRQQSSQDWKLLGSRYASTWSIEGFGTDMVKAAPGSSDPQTSVAHADADAAPASESAQGAMLSPWTNPMALVTPSTPQNLKELTRAYREGWIVASVNANDRAKGKYDALELVFKLLRDGTFDPAVLNTEKVAIELVNHLLQNGLGKMLGHIIRHTPTAQVWRLDAINAQAAAEIAALLPWPEDPACQCDLRIRTQLGLDGGAQLVAFAAGVKPEQLTVRLDVYPYAEPGMVTQLVNARAGIALALRCYGVGIPEAAPLVALLGSVNVPLRALTIDGSRIVGAEPLRAVADLIRTCGVSRLELHNNTPEIEDAVLSCRPWDALKIGCKSQSTAPFAAGKVSARELHIVSLAQDRLVSTVVETMVATCKGLKAVVIEGAAVQVLSLARALDRNRGVRSIDAPLATASDADANTALTFLRRNTSIARVKLRAIPLVGGALMPLTPAYNGQLAQLVTGNRMLHPALSRAESVNSFAYNTSRVELGDVGQHIEGMLDPRDAVALSLTNKYAYARSRRPWEGEIDRLATLLILTSGAAFKEQLVLQLTELDDEFTELTDTAPSADTAADTVVEKVAVIQGAGVPNQAVVQAIGRALLLDRRASLPYLEAALAIGALPSEVWLKDVLDIDIHNAGIPS